MIVFVISVAEPLLVPLVDPNVSPKSHRRWLAEYCPGGKPAPVTPAPAPPQALVIAKISISAVTKAQFDSASNAVRLAFLASLKNTTATAASCKESEVTIVITAVTDSLARRRRLLALTTTGVDVQFAISAPMGSSVTEASIVTAVKTHIESKAFATALSTSGVTRTTLVLSAPASTVSAGDDTKKSSDDAPWDIVAAFTKPITFAIAGGAALGFALLVGIIYSIVLVIVVVVGKSKNQDQKPHSSTVEMTSNPAHMVKLEQPAEENAAAVKTLSASADVPPSTKAQNKRDQRKEAGRQRRAARKAAQDAAEAANDDEKTDDY